MSERTVRRLLVVTGTTFMLLFALLPFAYMLAVSVSPSPQAVVHPGSWHGTLAHYHAVLGGESLHLLAWLRNSLVVAGLSAVLTVAVAAPAAYALARLPVPGKGAVLFAVLAMSMFPQVSLVSYLFELMAALGWVNTWAALVVPYVAWTLPLSLWIMVSYIARLPASLDEAARIDGCSSLQVLYKVTLPLAAPGIFSTALLAFFWSFNEFLFALMLTTDHRARTVPVGVALFQGLHGETPWGEIMAAATVCTLPVLLLTILFQRRIIQGLTRGAVKG